MNNAEYTTLCVVNPTSANGRTPKAWRKIETALSKRGVSLEVRFTSRPGDATEITRQALRDGYNRVISVGGDGTLNEVVNGFFDSQGEKVSENTFLSLITMGTGGDFSRMLDTNTSLDNLYRLITDPQLRKCDLVRARFTNWQGQEECRMYINEADIGLGSEAVLRVNRNSKALGGFVSFLSAGLYTILTYRNRPMTITVDDQLIYAGKTGMVVVSNGSYFGGGMKVAPHAEIDDGLLEVVIVKDLGKKDLLANVANIYKGTHLQHPQVEHLPGCRVEIASSEDLVFEMDGETPGHGNITFEIMPAAMNLLV